MIIIINAGFVWCMLSVLKNQIKTWTTYKGQKNKQLTKDGSINNNTNDELKTNTENPKGNQVIRTDLSKF